MATNTFGQKSEAERQKHFIDNSELVGRTIKSIRYLTQEEADEMGWRKTAVLELDDGRVIIPQRDDEGNDSGVITVSKPNGEDYAILPNF